MVLEEAAIGPQPAISLLPLTLPRDTHLMVVSTRPQLLEAMREIVGEGPAPLFPILGMDIEWRPTFVKGEHTIPAIMQVSLPTGAIFIFHLRRLLPWLSQLEPLINNDHVWKCGFGIDGDARRLRELHLVMPAGFVDVGRMVEGFRQIGMKQAVEHLFEGFTLRKGQQMTNWEKFPLTKQQLEYAALDAFASMEVALELCRRGVEFVPVTIGPVRCPCASCGKESFERDSRDRQYYCHLCFEAWCGAQTDEVSARVPIA